MRHKPLLAVLVLAIAAIVLVALSQRDDAPPPPGVPTRLPALVEAVDAASTTAADAATPPPDTAREKAPALEPDAPATANAREGTELWGRVIEAGTVLPIANADVELQHRDADEFWNLDLKYGERITSVARTRTDAEGGFRFDVERARQYRLAVSARGYAPATVPKRTGGAQVIVELSRGATVDGVVRCDGKPVADVGVRIAVTGESIELARGRTDGGGAFRFTGLPAARVFVQVGSAEYEEAWKDLEIVASKEHHVEIELQRGKTLRGRVVEATTSTPIVDAEVSDSWTFKRVVRTDADGRFAIAGLRDSGFVMCHVRATGYASAGRNVAGRLGEEAEFRLERGGELAGRVVDAAGAAVASAYLAVCTNVDEAPGMVGADWIPAAVGADGRFQVLGLRPDQHYWLMARAGGFGTRVYALPRVLGSGERHDVGDVVLRAAGGIEGRVVDDAGAGIADQSVSIRGTNADSRAWLEAGAPLEVTQFTHRSARTDRSGVFRCHGLAAGKYEVTMRRRGSNASASATADVKHGALCEGIELVVPKGLTIAGKLAYADGKAVGDELAELYLQASSKAGDHEYSARPGSAGMFRFDGVADDEYTITAFGLPKGWSLGPVAGVRAGATDVKLLLERSAIVSGRVVDGAGNAVKAQVWARMDGFSGGSPMHATDDEGRFRLEVPPTFAGTVGAFDLPDRTRRGQLAGVLAGQTDVVIALTTEEPPMGRRVR